MDLGARGWVAFEVYCEIYSILHVRSTKIGTVIVFHELINSSCGLIRKKFSNRGHFFGIRERAWVAFALYGEIAETFGLKVPFLARLSYLMSQSISSMAPSFQWLIFGFKARGSFLLSFKGHIVGPFE